MKIIKHDLILTEDTTFGESIEVIGDIKGWYNLTVEGDIDARNIDALDINARDIDAGDIDAGDINAYDITALDIDARNVNARDIDARNIDALDITARNIDALDITARNIDARNIICESRIKKSKSSKTICGVYVKNRSTLERKERDLE